MYSISFLLRTKKNPLNRHYYAILISIAGECMVAIYWAYIVIYIHLRCSKNTGDIELLN